MFVMSQGKSPANYNHNHRIMSHEINIENGKAAFVSVKEKPWHGLGQIVAEAMTSEEAIKLGGLNYEVSKKPAIFQNPLTGELEDVPGKFVNIRMDTGKPLGVVGSKYEIVQNDEAFSFFDAIVGKGEAIFETAGALGDGERMFITAKLPAHISVRGEEIEEYLFLYNSHDGSGSIVAAFTPIRVVCNNTLNAALRNMKMKVAIRHTSSVKARLETAYKVLNITNSLHNELGDLFNVMAKKNITDRTLWNLITETIGGDAALNKIAKGEELSTRMNNMIEDVHEYALGHDTQQTIATKGTLFGAYNAVTGYFQNIKEYKSDEKALISVTEGTGAFYGQKMFSLCAKQI